VLAALWLLALSGAGVWVVAAIGAACPWLCR
jgi:hypothetical protein